MAVVGHPMSRSPFQGDSHGINGTHIKSIPILPSTIAPSSSGTEAMDVSKPEQSAPTANMAPPVLGSPIVERPSDTFASPQVDQHTSSTLPVGAVAAAHQPKVVQTAFIHKLYNMLEDQTIQHLISWSNTNESFVMSPSSEFSKVLAYVDQILLHVPTHGDGVLMQVISQYFKHTNISSFVRQLNMYGFHKVSDVFHTGAPDAPLWEFKHGAGNFKRGDLVGLREIKRRASRHALIHRESFSANPPKVPQLPLPPQHPGPPMEPMPDPVEARLNMLEWNTQDLYARLTRTEEAYTAVATKCEVLLEGLTKCHQWNQELSSQLLSLVPDPDNPVHRDVSAMRQDIMRQVDQLRNMEDPHDAGFTSKQSYFHNTAMPIEPTMSMSPRQRPFDDSRRPSLQAFGRPNSFRTPIPPHLQISPRRYGSIGNNGGAYSPTSTRPNYPLPPPPPPPQPQQQQPHPLSNMTSPPGSLLRRHTSADIRVHGWPGGQNPSQYNQGNSPYASGQSSAQWPSSPKVAPQPGDQQLQDALAQYELPRASNTGSRQPSPPPSQDSGVPSFSSSFGHYANSNDAGWQLPGPRYPFKSLEAPGGPSRRSSMASNVHSLLNPADTAERDDEDEGPDERKRKRLL
ncbi:hypothetical protein BAUCODRAFT_151200 [Baudoinia panamericana UAMH 10762]|uniref:HSF-type DNA-binding domain-containing protein n=1 Tax=Baudoinia panamericana (strain UAMH 10762) TaxID=717646 RepID=M2N1H2_BAUPA|nr:uncharacterized protein BAUCODRAFT_151200 [Baudoinia panamericana UAMH 10762]EMC92794.1 hypothetical protein BAUCODRAFT_151200 [Baudoinia panamericana UAMH 10762]